MNLTLTRCTRCGHPSAWHSHDDVACHSEHPQPCYPWTAPYRCLGYDCRRAGAPAGTPETRCGCPDYVAPALEVPR